MKPKSENHAIRHRRFAAGYFPTVLALMVLFFEVGELVAADQPELQAIKNQKDTDLSLMDNHDTDLARQMFQLLPGFEVNLFAAEPMLANPVHMTWDERGRLWVACSWSYPQMRPGEEPNDKIIILEDTDSDGRADKSTVFVEGLYIPTGLALSGGGVYVAQAPDILYLEDTDGDDRADVRYVILTGFGIEDSHHAISAWRRGPAGWIYFQEGTFLNSQVETQYGTVRLTYGGVFQYQPLTQKLQVFADIRVGNPWGHMFDRWGQSIFIDNPRVHFLTPTTANSRLKLQHQPLISTEKQCGGDFISGRHFPPELRGQILTNRFKSQTVIRYSLQDDGSGFSARLEEPIIKTRHPNFRPVDCKMGPDGALYICDWYNPIINHARHNFRDPRRDVQHGRIWRVTHKDRPVVEKPKLLDVPLPELLDHLKAPEQWTRHQVKLVLGRMPPKTVAAALAKWVDTLDSQDPDYDHHLLEALWSLQNVNVVDEDLLTMVLQSKTGEARAAAVRVIRYWHPQLSDPLALLANAVTDDFPRVRLEAVLSASFIPDAKALPIALRVLDFPRDRFLDHALKLTVNGLENYWLPAFESGNLEFSSEGQRLFAISSTRNIEMGSQLTTILSNRNTDPQFFAAAMAKVAAHGSESQLKELIKFLQKNKKAAPGKITEIITALDQSARQRGLVNSRKFRLNKLLFLLKRDEPQIIEAMIHFAGTCKISQAAGPLREMLKADRFRPPSLVAIATAIGEIGGTSNQKYLEKMTGDDRPPEQRYLGVIGLAALDLQSAAPSASKVLAADPEDADPTSVVNAFGRRQGGADLLAKAVERTKPHPRVAVAVTSYFNETGQLNDALIDAFGSASSTDLFERLLAEDVAELASEVVAQGDPVHGEEIFRRKEMACMSCHGIAGAGPTLGPDLAAIGSATQPDYIVDSILRPSKHTAEMYQSVKILTEDGTIHNGVSVFKGKEEVVIRDAAQQGKKITIPRKKIEMMVDTPSLMPVGLVNQLKSRTEFLDLASFVSQLGRVGKFQTSVRPIIRRWQVHLLSNGPFDIFVDEAQWRATYSMVSGLLPAVEFESYPRALVRGHVDVSRQGKVRSKINSTKGLTLWIDDKKVSDVEVALELTRGRRTLTFLIDNRQRGDLGLRVELTDVPGSSAVYQIVGGP